MNGQRDSEVFYKHLLDKMIVFRDGRVEVQLNFLPKKWVFLLEKGKQ